MLSMSSLLDGYTRKRCVPLRLRRQIFWAHDFLHPQKWPLKSEHQIIALLTPGENGALLLLSATPPVSRVVSANDSDGLIKLFSDFKGELLLLKCYVIPSSVFQVRWNTTGIQERLRLARHVGPIGRLSVTWHRCVCFLVLTGMLCSYPQFIIYSSYFSVITVVFVFRGLFTLWTAQRRAKHSAPPLKNEPPEFVEHKFWSKRASEGSQERKITNLQITDCKHQQYKSFFIQNKMYKIFHISI